MEIKAERKYRKGQTWIQGPKREESRGRPSPDNGTALAALETRSPDDGSLGWLQIRTLFHFLSR